MSMRGSIAIAAALLATQEAAACSRMKPTDGEMTKSKQNDLLVLESCAVRPSGWRPFRGAYAAACRLEAQGLIQQCGTDVMPPYVLYVITDKGRKTLAARSQSPKGGAE
jgi:hypothetical protein